LPCLGHLLCAAGREAKIKAAKAEGHEKTVHQETLEGGVLMVLPLRWGGGIVIVSEAGSG
jgi:hypothetical protein